MLKGRNEKWEIKILNTKSFLLGGFLLLSITSLDFNWFFDGDDGWVVEGLSAVGFGSLQ